MSSLRIPWSLHPEPVLQLLVIEIVDDHRKDIADLALMWERDLREGLRLTLSKEHQRATRSMGGEDGKIHTTRHMTRSVGKSMSIAHPKSPVLVSVVKGSAHFWKL